MSKSKQKFQIDKPGLIRLLVEAAINAASNKNNEEENKAGTKGKPRK